MFNQMRITIKTNCIKNYVYMIWSGLSYLEQLGKMADYIGNGTNFQFIFRTRSPEEVCPFQLNFNDYKEENEFYR